MSSNDVAIIGMDCVLPGACDLAQYWDNLVEGVDAISDVPAGRLNGRDRLPAALTSLIPCNRGGFIPRAFRFNPLRFGIMPSIVPHGDPDQFLMLHVIAGALDDAGVAADAPARQHTDVIVGRGGYITNKISELYYRSDLLGHLLHFLARRFPELSPDELAQVAEELRSTAPGNDADSLTTSISNLTASRTANRLDLRGAAYVIDAACASALLAVEQGVQRLRAGLSDLAVAGGIFLCQTPTFWLLFTQLGAMSSAGRIRPFDRRADGVLIGEGAGAVVLKRLADAQRDGDRVYAVIKGVGTSCDGRDTHILTSSSRGQVAALQNAYADAQLDPATIGYLEAHGTATPAGDLAELRTIKQFYGRRGPHPSARAMGSVKSMLGHTMPAAGIAALIKTALALSNKCLPPSLHCDEPHAELADAPFYVNRETRPWIHPRGRHPRRAGVSAFGFGGINAHVVLEEVPETTAEGVVSPLARPICVGGQRDSELVVFSADSVAALSTRLDRVFHFLATVATPPALADVAATTATEIDFAHPHKLALLCHDLDELSRVLTAVREQLATSPEPLDETEQIYYSASADRPTGQIAGIFPGMGFPGLIGNYPAHLMTLCRHVPEVRRLFDAAELRDEHREDPVPTSLIFFPPSLLPDEVQTQLRARIAAMKALDAEHLNVAPWERNIAASCVTFTNWVSWRLLKRLEVPVDMLCGQSQGEIAAMCAGGIVDFALVMPRLWQALAISPVHAATGRLAFIGVSEDRVAPYLHTHPNTAIAIHVAPQMLILGGPDAEVVEICEQLRTEGVITQVLPYPPIHTPRVSAVREELTRLIDMNVEIRRPTVAVYSAITSDLFPTVDEEIRALAMSNLDRPVRFWQTVHRMYDDGARMFLQVGGGTLAANIKSILPRNDILGTAVDLDHRDPITQLHHLCARLFTRGYRFKLGALDEGRRIQHLDFDHPVSPAPPQQMLLPLQMDWTAIPAVATDGTSLPAAPTPTSPADDVPAAETPTSSAAVPEPVVAGDTSAAAGPVLPMLGEVVRYEPDVEVLTRRRLDLNEDLHLHDHVLISASSGKAVEHRGPVLPMAMILEVAAETAACLAPGLGLVGFEHVVAERWIELRDTRTLQLEVHGVVESVDAGSGLRRIAVEVRSDGHRSAVAVVLFAAAYPHQLQLPFSPLANPRPWPLTPAEMYDRYMFHGPLYHCVTQLCEMGDQGLTGEITVQAKGTLYASTQAPQMLTDPVVFDGVLQLVAMWVMTHGPFLMPAKIGRLEFFGPTPPPGTRVPVQAEIRSMNYAQRTVTSDCEVGDGQGGVWYRMEGVSEWMYDYSPALLEIQRHPERRHVATPLAIGGVSPTTVAVVLPRNELRHATTDWLGRLFLHQHEWEYLEQLSPPSYRWQWLMERIAVKDAARLHLASRMDAEMAHPAWLQVTADPTGRACLVPLEGWPPMPAVSFAYADGCALAMAAESACGIDAEPCTRDVEPTTFATPEEIDLLAGAEAAVPDQFWPARLYAAKRAAAKALAGQWSGQTDEFQAIDVEPQGQILLSHRASATTHTVATLRHESLVIAYASLDCSGPQSPAPDMASGETPEEEPRDNS
jgi:acyl transferase domain-containing protein